MSGIERYNEKRKAETEELATIKAKYQRLLKAAKFLVLRADIYPEKFAEEFIDAIREAEEGKE